MTIKNLYGALSVATGATGCGLYILSIVKQQTRPHVLTWLVWALGSSIIFAVQIYKHAGAGSWATGYTALNCIVITILAMRFGEKNITLSDKVSFTLALASIPLWFITHDPLYAVVLIVMTEVLGFYPTFRKSYTHPQEEKILAYALGILQCSLSLMAMRVFSLAAILYPAACIVTNGSFIAFACIRRYQLFQQTHRQAA